jgi:hypothetical protein
VVKAANAHHFVSMADARSKVDAWRIDYDQHRRHGSFGHLTPSELLSAARRTVAKKRARSSYARPAYGINVTSQPGGHSKQRTRLCGHGASLHLSGC